MEETVACSEMISLEQGLDDNKYVEGLAGAFLLQTATRKF